MNTFEDFKIKKQLVNAIADLGFTQPTPIQEESYSTILAGSDFVGIAQTGTGKTIAYLLPILQGLEFSEQPHPRVVILAPTRELVIQIVEQIEKLTPYITVRTLGVYGGTNNIKGQKLAVAEGVDIIVGTPRRLYDLVISNVLRLKSIKKLVIDEVDIMLDFGYKTQLKNIFEHLPTKRQNILFSATMTTYVDELIDTFLINPVKKTISLSGTPLENISQSKYAVPNFYTKANLLNHLLEDKEEYSKVLIFVGTKVNADRLFETLDFESESSVIHSRKEQNHRTNSIDKFANGTSRILIATDVIARGIDIDKISHVISFDTPFYPENYMHRIGRTGRAEQKGKAILLYSEKEETLMDDIESLMTYTIPEIEWPEEVTITGQLTPEEKLKPIPLDEIDHKSSEIDKGASFQEKSAKNSKELKERKSYDRLIKERYKKPIRRGDKIQNMKKKKRK
ncbi:DEAD/DEAH box helicase [Arcticibacterium luteifluviistationis]|uniref:DEAD/DEAH box helicase n=1 Tax=Arcticibacterium luteifluviistationis TaxID=1784714 RepID=A0A2Z4G7Q5_9BACT|nr:DEAD/DEAH box helicase [Arcticibacterium luteifluviistationis]AWV97098.1 DEAD/DEAH box helicase [Arcticibacterium luteifluviistationis]